MRFGEVGLEFLISINMQGIKFSVGRGWGLFSSFNLIYDLFVKKFCHPNRTLWSNDFLVEESLSFCEDEECHLRDEGTIAAALKISPADSDLNCCM